MGKQRKAIAHWLPGLSASLVFLILSASCAGGVQELSTSGDTAAALSTASGDNVLAATADTAASSSDSNASILPAIPLDSASDRGASAAGDPPPPGAGGQVVVLGKDCLAKWNAEISGDALALDPPGTDAGEGMGERVAFGLYQANAGAGNRPQSLAVQCTPGGLGQQYFVALADYTKLQWQFFGPSSIPEFSVDLTGRNHRFVSQLGNVYFLVLCFNENTATHLQTTLLFGADNGGGLPGCPFKLRATDGDFPERVEVGWEAGGDSTHYEVFRRAVANDPNAPVNGDPPPADGTNPPPPADGTNPPPPADGSNPPPPADGSNPPPPGDGTKPPPPPNDDPDSVWRLIAIVNDNHFADFEVFPGRRYEYRVRAFNAQGPSGDSNIDVGWAKPRIFSAEIHGLVVKDGQGVPGVVMTLLGASAWPLHTVTGPNGGFAFNHLPALNYIVYAQNPNLEFEPEFRPVDLHLGETENLLFTARNAEHFGRVWGFAYGWDPIRDDGTGGLRLLHGVNVGIQAKGAPEGSAPLQLVQTDALGRYEFHGLQPGEYVEKAGLPGLIFFPERRPVFSDGQHVSPVLNFFGWKDWHAGDPPPPADGGNGDPGTSQ